MNSRTSQLTEKLVSTMEEPARGTRPTDTPDGGGAAGGRGARWFIRPHDRLANARGSGRRCGPALCLTGSSNQPRPDGMRAACTQSHSAATLANKRSSSQYGKACCKAAAAAHPRRPGPEARAPPQSRPACSIQSTWGRALATGCRPSSGARIRAVNRPGGPAVQPSLAVVLPLPLLLPPNAPNLQHRLPQARCREPSGPLP